MVKSTFYFRHWRVLVFLFNISSSFYWMAW